MFPVLSFLFKRTGETMFERILNFIMVCLMLALTLTVFDLALNANSAKNGIKKHLLSNNVKAYRSIK